MKITLVLISFLLLSNFSYSGEKENNEMELDQKVSYRAQLLNGDIVVVEKKEKGGFRTLIIKKQIVRVTKCLRAIKK